MKKIQADVYASAETDLYNINEMDEIILGGEEYEYLDVLRDPDIAEKLSEEAAVFVKEYIDDDNKILPEEERVQPYEITSYSPKSGRLGTRFANTFKKGGRTWAIDFSYAAVDPNHDFPYVDTVENWRKDVESGSNADRPDVYVPPPDPRAGVLPKVEPGSYNPLLEKAIVEEPHEHDGYITQYLSVDSVKVAVVKYSMKDGKPVVSTLETRPEYRHQGYMKTLLKKVAENLGVEKLSSYGHYTQKGFDYTRHLTNHDMGEKPQIMFTSVDDYDFVHDWIEGSTL